MLCSVTVIPWQLSKYTGIGTQPGAVTEWYREAEVPCWLIQLTADSFMGGIAGVAVGRAVATRVGVTVHDLIIWKHKRILKSWRRYLVSECCVEVTGCASHYVGIFSTTTRRKTRTQISCMYVYVYFKFLMMISRGYCKIYYSPTLWLMLYQWTWPQHQRWARRERQVCHVKTTWSWRASGNLPWEEWRPVG